MKSKTILIVAVVIVVVLLSLVAIVVIRNRFGTEDATESKITGLSSYTDISYGAEPSQKFDVYVPKSATVKFPLIIFIHGGAWIAGDKSDVTALPSSSQTKASL